MDFSFVLPTLGNPDMVIKFLDSLQRTTRSPKDIEVLFAIDKGKTDIIDIVDNENYSFSTDFYECEKTNDFTNNYYNRLASRTKGENIIAFNDDAWMRTNHWDDKIRDVVSFYRWSIYMLDLPDTARIKYGNTFPCFPCVSRRAFCTLGWLLCPKIRMYPADKVTHSIYKEANRVIPVNTMLIEHEHVIETDDSKAHMLKSYREDPATKNGIDVSEYVIKLATASLSDIKRPSKFRRIMNIINGG